MWSFRDLGLDPYNKKLCIFQNYRVLEDLVATRAVKVTFEPSNLRPSLRHLRFYLAAGKERDPNQPLKEVEALNLKTLHPKP